MTVVTQPDGPGLGHNLPPLAAQSNPHATLSRVFGWTAAGLLATTVVSALAARNGIGMEAGRAGTLGIACGGALLTLATGGVSWLMNGRHCGPT